MNTNITYRWNFHGGICHIFYAVSRFVMPWLKMAEKKHEKRWKTNLINQGNISNKVLQYNGAHLNNLNE